jgi:nucleoside triphosphate pyrophosphatase
MKKIILASTSPRRKELLSQLGLDFSVVSSNYEEDMSLDMKPVALAKFLSMRKAESVAKKYKNTIIIAADTFIVHGTKLLGKPFTAKEAKNALKKISNKILYVITGLAVIDTKNNKKISKAIETKVYIKKLSNSEIDNYIKTGEPLDKAGAFGIQGFGAVIVKKIEGDYNNVVGLPLHALAETLKEFGIKII